jgi:chromosome segregation ATPase
MRSRIEDLQEQYRNEAKNRELFENEVQALKATIQNLTKNYEGALHNSQVTLEKEIDIQRIRNKDIESELNKAHQVIEDLRRSEHELKKVVNDLEEESGRLRAQKKDAENKFRRITEEMSSV